MATSAPSIAKPTAAALPIPESPPVTRHLKQRVQNQRDATTRHLCLYLLPVNHLACRLVGAESVVTLLVRGVRGIGHLGLDTDRFAFISLRVRGGEVVRLGESAGLTLVRVSLGRPSDVGDNLLDGVHYMICVFGLVSESDV